MCRVGQNHTHIRCIYGIFGREIIKYTVIYGVYIYTILANPTYVTLCGSKSQCICWFALLLTGGCYKFGGERDVVERGEGVRLGWGCIFVGIP